MVKVGKLPIAIRVVKVRVSVNVIINPQCDVNHTNVFTCSVFYLQKLVSRYTKTNTKRFLSTTYNDKAANLEKNGQFRLHQKEGEVGSYSGRCQVDCNHRANNSSS